MDDASTQQWREAKRHAHALRGEEEGGGGDETVSFTPGAVFVAM